VSRDFKQDEHRAPIVSWIEDGLTPPGLRAFGISVSLPDNVARSISAGLLYPALPLSLYQDGYNLYRSYFAPNSLDPTGHEDESGDPGKTCSVDPTLYCVYILSSFPANETLGGKKPDGGNELSICIACAPGSTGATPCPMISTNYSIRVKTDSGGEFTLSVSNGSSGCTSCPDGAAKGEKKGKQIIPKVTNLLK